jgi:hypothetical protein
MASQRVPPRPLFQSLVDSYRVSQKMCRSAEAPRTGAHYGAPKVGCVFLTRARIRPHTSGRADLAIHFRRDLRFAASGVFTRRLRSIGRGSPAGEPLEVPLGHTPGSISSLGLRLLPFPSQRGPSALCTTPTPEPAGAIEGRPSPPPSVAVDPRPSMIAKIRSHF